MLGWCDVVMGWCVVSVVVVVGCCVEVVLEVLVVGVGWGCVVVGGGFGEWLCVAALVVSGGGRVHDGILQTVGR